MLAKPQFILGILIIFLNTWRFIGLDSSPPGFYWDEAAGATQIICIKETGFDYYGKRLPLFSVVLPYFGVYTPGYLYGQAAWSSIFGYSISAFRAFSAFTTCLTLLFLFLWVKNKTNRDNALLVIFAASIMPWAFQFSRIAWDPPLAVLFLIASLWATSLKRNDWISGVFLAFAAYSYSPIRFMAPIFGLLIPGYPLKKKLVSGIIFALLCIPLLLQLNTPEFLARAHDTTLWGKSKFNPYLHLSFTELIPVFIRQFYNYLSFDFLFNSGDTNLRHSTQRFGMLSWLDAIVILFGPIYLLYNRIIFKNEKVANSEEWQLIWIAFIGIILGILPAALTHGPPNALRAIAAWPFFAILSGTLLTILLRKFENINIAKVFIGLGVIFFVCYLLNLYLFYPRVAAPSFESGYDAVTFSYFRMSRDKLSCEDIKKEPEPLIPNLNPEKPLVGKEILFSEAGYGKNYLRYYWQAPESWGVWSNRNRSEISIPAPDGTFRGIGFRVRAMITQDNPIQNIEVSVNGGYPNKLRLDKFENNYFYVEVDPVSLKNKKFINLTFEITNPINPKLAGISPTDDRYLGIGLISAKFE